MANSSTNLDPISSTQSGKETTANAFFDAASQAALYGRRAAGSSGLTWAYYGGNVPISGTPTFINNGSVALTAEATNYVEANPADGVVSANTSGFTSGRWHLYTVVAGAATVTSYTDHRFSGMTTILGTGTVTSVDVTPPAAGITVSGGPVTTSGAIALALANDLAALEGLSSTGVPNRTGTDTWSLLTVDSSSALGTSNTTLPTQGAVKGAIDAALAGLSWKQAVRAATTAAGTLSTSFANGQTVDGVTLATGDRILVKDQATGSENGIYVVAASGAPSRATDADSGAELVNASVYVSEGTTNADTQWTCTTNATITVGTTSLSFAQLTSGGSSSPTTTKGDLIVRSSSADSRLAVGSNGQITVADSTQTLGMRWANPVQAIPIACSDESTALTTGTAKVTFRMPFAFTLTGVRASLTTAQADGSIFTVDINESGTSVLSTKLTIDNTEKTSTTAATASVISDSALADDAEITIDIDQVGDGTAKGLKVYLIGYPTL